MLARPVPRVDDRHRRDTRRSRRGAGLVMAQHDEVGVRRHHAHRVLERLALDRAREGVRRLGPDHRAAEAEHRRFEAQPGPRARLVEECGHDPVREAVVAHPGQGGGAPKDDVEQLAIELLGGDHVAEHPVSRSRCRHGASPSSPGGFGQGRPRSGAAIPCRPLRTCLKWMRFADSTLECRHGTR